MVLIAGDLFHDNKPTRRTLHKTMEIIRRYSMGPDAVQIQIVSDQATNFRSVHGTVNYEDEFYSVGTYRHFILLEGFTKIPHLRARTSHFNNAFSSIIQTCPSFPFMVIMMILLVRVELKCWQLSISWPSPTW